MFFFFYYVLTPLSLNTTHCAVDKATYQFPEYSSILRSNQCRTRMGCQGCNTNTEESRLRLARPSQCREGAGRKSGQGG